MVTNNSPHFNNTMSIGKRIFIIVFVLAIAAFASVGGFWLAREMRGAEPIPDQTLLRDGPLLQLPHSKELAAFTLYDHTGAEFNNASLEGNWRLVFFGFASCPHICPDTLFRLRTVVDQLEGELSPEDLPKVLLISVDPERDTPEVLTEYLKRFDNKIEAVSGEDAQLRQLAMDFGAHYVVPEHEPGEWYNVDHSASVHVVDPNGDWVGLLSAPHEPEAMAAALARFID